MLCVFLCVISVPLWFFGVWAFHNVARIPMGGKSEIRNPKFREGGWSAFRIPNSEFKTGVRYDESHVRFIR